MAIEMGAALLDDMGAAELTQLGKRIEILRIERSRSKLQLARHAGTSRQQLWRVMTGKSALTSALRDRLASALGVDVALLAPGEFTPSSGAAITIDDYLADPHLLTATLRTMPSGDGGRRLKRALLNALEDLAVEMGRTLPIDSSEIHRRVLAGEL